MELIFYVISLSHFGRDLETVDAKERQMKATSDLGEPDQDGYLRSCRTPLRSGDSGEHCNDEQKE